jgi:hypothetical protein
VSLLFALMLPLLFVLGWVGEHVVGPVIGLVGTLPFLLVLPLAIRRDAARHREERDRLLVALYLIDLVASSPSTTCTATMRAMRFWRWWPSASGMPCARVIWSAESGATSSWWWLPACSNRPFVLSQANWA